MICIIPFVHRVQVEALSESICAQVMPLNMRMYVLSYDELISVPLASLYSKGMGLSHLHVFVYARFTAVRAARGLRGQTVPFKRYISVLAACLQAVIGTFERSSLPVH